MSQAGEAEQEISHGMSKGGWPDSQRGNAVLLDQQEDSIATYPVTPLRQKSPVQWFLDQPGPKQVAVLRLDAFYMISPNETHGQDDLIGFTCWAYYSSNK